MAEMVGATLLSSAIGSLLGGGGGLGGGVDLQAITDAVTRAQGNIHNRYAQLGLGIPSGDPAQAAKSGTSLSYAGPGTAEQTDIQGAANQGQALAGQLETQFPGGQSFAGGLNLASIANLAGFNANSASQGGGIGIPQVG